MSTSTVKDGASAQQQAEKDLGIQHSKGTPIAIPKPNVGLRPNGSTATVGSTPKIHQGKHTSCYFLISPNKTNNNKVEQVDEKVEEVDEIEEQKGEVGGDGVGELEEDMDGDDGEKEEDKREDESAPQSVSGETETSGEKGDQKVEQVGEGTTSVKKASAKKKRLIEPEEQPSEFYVWIRSFCGCAHY